MSLLRDKLWRMLNPTWVTKNKIDEKYTYWSEIILFTYFEQIMLQ